MPALIESFASYREPAWHQLGEVFTDEVTSGREMLDRAHLSGWNVRVEDIPLPDTYSTENPSYWVVRDHPTDGHPDVLATVGSRYNVVQNEELFDFADTLLDGARWETAGSLKNGRVVFGSLALERDVVLDPTGVADVVKTYLLATTSHDGSTAFQALITPVRVVCANTLQVALQGAKQSFKIRHTQSIDGKIAAAREVLGLANTYMDAFEIEARELFEAEVTKAKFDAILMAAYPKPDKDAKGSFKKWENKIEELNEIYVGDTNGMIAGTAWGAFNAMTERLDWFRTARGGNTENTLAAASGFDAATNVEKNRLLKVVKSLALV